MPASTAMPDAAAETTPVLSYSPVALRVPGRPVDLSLRVTAPATGSDLPVVLLSHGHGGALNLSSEDGYMPIAHRWAAAGFVVVQPTHLSSRRLGHLWETTPGAPLFWRSRAEDMINVLDRLDEIEKDVPLLAGRIDRDAIAVAGHSLGGFTAELLLGAGVTDPDSGQRVRYLEPRIKQGVLLAAPGRGGDTLNGPMADQVPAFRTVDFSTMTRPALVVAGDQDDSQHFTDMGPTWHHDPYHLAPGPKTLLTVFGAGHLLGGIQGYDAAESAQLSDENPQHVAAIAQLTAAYLRARFHRGDDAWRQARTELTTGPGAVGRLESK
ncbi:chlorophyllase [Streptomyces smyrnaeus]|uniref:Chlorophyllase n=1 Tax=Streptomyces smyrnaeus TaxID=1387713 RepID=A0ABS3XT98_9ACTN|nr:chlorophyllase [Streptomyces smyrnaeus]MBO8198533.1 chlorophyllase [Streptomyces smyrnaeus]